VSEIARHVSPQALADLGFVDLVVGRGDRAISRLGAARQQAPGDAGIASDLAAAYMERGLSRGQGGDLALALDTAEAALALAPASPEAWFNAALARESFGLSRPAVVAWDRYLELDPASGWAKEAHWHRQAAAVDPWQRWRAATQSFESAGGAVSSSALRGIVDAFPQASRLYGEVQILTRWAEAQTNGDQQKAVAALGAARCMGQLLAGRGDHMLVDSVAAIDRVAQRPAKLSALAQGYLRYAAGAHLYASYKSEQAQSLFALAARDLARGGSPFQRWAILSLASCDYQDNRYAAALAKISLVSRPGDPPLPYPSLAGRADWLRGLIAQIDAQPAVALKSELAALADFERGGESDSAGTVEGLVTEAYGILGDDVAAWKHLRRALAATATITDRRSRQGIWHVAAEAARLAGALHAALGFEEEALEEAKTGGSAAPITVASCDVATLRARLGDRAGATRALEAGRSAAREAHDDALSAQVLLTEASILGPSRGAAAIADLSAALPLLAKTGYTLRLAALYRDRGRLFAAAGSTAEAAADFATGIEHLEASAANIAPLQRIDYLDRSSGLWGEQIQLSARHEWAPYARTFCQVERAHRYAGAAWQLPRGRWPAGCEPALLARSLPPGATLIEYLVLPERVIVWVLAGAGFRAAEISLPEKEVTRLATSLHVAVARHGNMADLPDRLYQALIAPLGLPADGSLLLIVPDRALHELPFAALRNSASGRYLAEEHALALLPSAGAVRDHRGATGERARAPTVLVVGEPALDRLLLPNLPRLPAATEETAAINALYSPLGRVDVLSGAAATKRRVLAALTGHTIIHLAVHAEADRRSPLFSRFFLAPAEGDPGVLFAHELYGRTFPQTELVVLAGCGTASGALSPSGGVMSLARPFLAGGADSVLANLWAVDDQAAGAFSAEFHHVFSATRDAPRALHESQQRFIHSPNSAFRDPAAWSGFVLAAAAAPGGATASSSRSQQAENAIAGPSHRLGLGPVHR
jgi:CHAT domain-containing protein/tetratricopeptide (TPR) repeat protein